MFRYYFLSIFFNIGPIFIAVFFNLTNTKTNWIIIVAIISIIFHYIILRFYRKLAFTEVTKENLNDLNSKLSRLESLRQLTYTVTPLLCLIFLL